MTSLVRPDVDLHPSWAAATLAFGSEQVHGSGAWELPEGRRHDVTRGGCELAVTTLLSFSDPAAVLPEGRVSCDYFWITAPADGGRDQEAEEEVVGFIALRHRLNAFLLEEGGHIGYSVRPDRRRRGYASDALASCLLRAAEIGIDQALVTCDDDNTASRRTIENAGGAYEDTRNGKRRYWIATGQ